MTSQEARSPWLAQGDEKRGIVRQMFADIAPSYDLLNSLMSCRMHRRWRERAVSVLALRPGDRALDVCCGTGDFVSALRRAVGETGLVLGVDFCEPMLARAREKLGPGGMLALSDACALPVADGSFDAVTVGWGLRNVADVDAALREAARVLKPGGRFVTIDMARPRGRFLGRFSSVVYHQVAPLLGRLFGKTTAYRYLPESTERFLSREAMKEAMERAGFSDVQHRDFYVGNVCMHWGTACR